MILTIPNPQIFPSIKPSNVQNYFRITFAAVLITGLFFSALAVSVSAQDPTLRITNPLDTPPRSLTITQIDVTGAETRSESMILATAGLSVGEQITIPGPAIGDAIQRLFRTGLFSDVQIYQISRTGSQVHLEIEVREQPRLDRFEITGPRRSQRRDLRDLIPMIPGFAVTESTKAQSVNAIMRYYRERGFRNTEVVIVERDRDEVRNRVTLEFQVDPGRRIQIHEITFEGNESFSDRKLRGELREIKRTNLWRTLTRQTFDQASFEEAQENLINFYQQNGFRDIRIVEDSVFVFERSRGREGIGVFMRLEEGPQYRVRNIAFDGNTIYTEEELIASLGFERGDVFDQERFESNMYGNRRNNDITALYHDIGHLFLDLDIDIRDAPGDSLDIFIGMVENDIATINRVEFFGNTKTHDHVVRRNLRNIPGGNYSRSAIQRTVRELAQLGYFVPENIMPDLDVDFENRKVDVIYALDETAGSDNFELSGGFGGRQFGVILSARVNFNNFSARNILNGESWRPLPSGDGQRLSLGVQLTGRGYRSYNFSFQEPWLFGLPNSLGFGANYSYFRFSNLSGQNERYEQFSTFMTLGRRLTFPDDFFTQVTTLRFQLFDSAFPRGLIEPGRSKSLSLRLGLNRNSLDNPISPNSGSTFDIGVELAAPLAGLDQYYLADISFTQHVPLFGRLVASTGFEYGYLGWFNDNNRSQYQRFYLGGTLLQQQQTFYQNNIELRGFPGGRNGSISPYLNGEPIGGSIYSKYIAEIRYPAVSSEQVTLVPYLFFEAGNAYADFDEFDPFRVKRAVGIGTRVFLPILGLIDLSYGYRLDGIPGTNVNAGQWEFLFNIGSPF
ncbi:Beta-barrel assembly machine subunit BamA [Cyclonatronum proteinivorum]|uniref:Outer membrane protein assembly factor BamA n=1 Tax=Cyclonatronum proteinivorum TaxID=1457365 RepID=A0A345UMS7_9BACT|nr:outer membrane protein assembly factor BamA [Cyclonatronum proteinivorum]AXJ01779.1 Beta-barrel assembly machine subunit BamA [Cyclonatronum proteinivorum]